MSELNCRRIQGEPTTVGFIQFLGRAGAAFPSGRELHKIDKILEVRSLYSVTQPKLME